MKLTVNGKSYEIDTEPRRLLTDVIRQEIGLFGTHLGCEHGVCGACTVLIDGRPTLSCLVFAVQCEGEEITTVEGLVSASGVLHPVQQAFINMHGLQCGFCTPGFLVTIAAMAERIDIGELPDSAIREELSGNICRCTSYVNIVAAVKEAARLAKEAENV